MTIYILALIAVAVVVELYTRRHALDGVEYDLRMSKPVAEADEKVQMITIVTNRKRRFLPFIRLNENVPTGIDMERELYVESFTDKRSLLRSTVYMMPRQRLTRRTTFSMPMRGRHIFKGATLNGGDFLGLTENSVRYPLEREFVVLPKPAEAGEVERLLGGYMGDTSVNRFILEDPILTLGFREYTGREPMKMISWTQSARAGQLMVKSYDYTVERTATVLLNADTFAFGAYGEAMLERCYSLARGVCEALEEKRIPYSFLCNTVTPGASEGFGEVSDGLGQAHLMTVLEGLGRASYDHRETLEDTFERAAARASRGRMHIFITPVDNDLHALPLRRLEEATGEAVITLVAGREAAA